MVDLIEVKKLSIKTVIGNVRELLRTIEKDKGGIDLYVLGGVATGFSTGTGNYGDWTKIQGDFLCTNLITGEVYKAPATFVQEPVQGFLLNALSTHGDVEFMVRVRLMRDDSSPVGYTYILTPVLNAEQTDKLKNVRNRMAAFVAEALPAPKAEPESAPEKPAGKKKGDAA
jgi:hypothetical protein